MLRARENRTSSGSLHPQRFYPRSIRFVVPTRHLLDWLLGATTVPKSPTWHRRQRAVRAKARRLIHKNRALGQEGRVPPAVRRALQLLSRHHSQPFYREMYQWGGKGGKQSWAAWSPQMPKGARGKRAGADKEKAKEKDKREAGVAKPYDATSLPSSSQAQQSDNETNLFKDFMEFLKEAKVEIPEKFKKHLPDSTKEDIKLQQKRLNRHRTVVNRIENKKVALEKDKEKWTAWLTSIKEEITAQRKKHMETQQQLEKDIAAEEEQKLRNPEEPQLDDYPMMEEDVDGLVEALASGEEPKDQETRFVLENADALKMMQQNMERRYNQKLEEEKMRLQQSMEKDLQNYKKMMDVQEILSDTEEAAAGARATMGLGGVCVNPGQNGVPFGAQRVSKLPQVSSPYDKTTKEEERSRREQAKMEKFIESRQQNPEDKHKDQQKPDTGQ